MGFNIIPDSEADSDIIVEDSEADSDVVITREVHNHSLIPTGGSCGQAEQSPLQEQQSPLSPSATRLLYQDGVCEDYDATEMRRKQLELTGKAPALEGRVKREVSSEQQGEPTQEEIDALAVALEANPALLRQLESGEGSSSNPRHIRRVLVFQAFLQQQQDAINQAQQQREQLQQVSEEAADNEAFQLTDSPPAAKRRRTMPTPRAAASGSDAGCSTRDHTGSEPQQPAAQEPSEQQEQEELDALQDDQAHESESEQPPPQQDQQDQQQQPPPRPVQQQQQRHQQQQQQQQPPPRQKAQPPPRPRARPAAQPAAAARGAGGRGGGSGAGRAMSREKQRALRSKLKRLDAKGAAERDLLLDSSNGQLLEYMRDLEVLGDSTTRVREAALHAGVLQEFTRTGADMVKAFSNQSRGRHPAQLINTLKYTHAADASAAGLTPGDAPMALDWVHLGAAAAAAGLFRTAPGVGSMLGALAGVAKARPKVVRQKRAAPEPEVRPVVGPAALEQEHGMGQETERVVTEMRRVLEAAGTCSAIQLVLDHDSYAHTLENVFALSFLCRDMFVRLQLDQERGLLVHSISRQERARLVQQHEAATSGGGARPGVARLTPHQFVMALDMTTWRDMCAVVDKRDPLMSQRAVEH